MCCCCLKQRLQLLTHPPLLEVATSGQPRSKWLRRRGSATPTEEWRGISVVIGVDVSSLVGASVVVACTSLG
jgi:hypothetical protein